MYSKMYQVMRGGTSATGSRDSDRALKMLRRDLRVLNRERHKQHIYDTHGQVDILKQQQEIDKLYRRQSDIQQSLLVSESEQDTEHEQRLGLLLEIGEIDGGVERERRFQTELERDITNVLKTLQKKFLTSNKQKSQAWETERAIRTLDHRLDLALSYCSEQTTKNARLRHELEVMQKERRQFQEFYHKLEQELQAIRKEIKDLIHVTYAAYDARVEALRKMTRMREKDAGELARYNVEREELRLVLERRQRLTDFAAVKCRERTPADAEEKGWIDGGGESMETLRAVFLRIKAVTGEFDMSLDMLVDKYVEGERINHELVNLIAEQSREIARLTAHNREVESEMQRMDLEDKRLQKLHEDTLRETNASLQEVEERLRKKLDALNDTNVTMAKIKELVTNILANIAAKERNALEEDCGGIGDKNIMEYLNLVESQTNYLLEWQASFEPKDETEEGEGEEGEEGD